MTHREFPWESVNERNLKIRPIFAEVMTKNQIYYFFLNMVSSSSRTMWPVPVGVHCLSCNEFPSSVIMAQTVHDIVIDISGIVIDCCWHCWCIYVVHHCHPDCYTFMSNDHPLLLWSAFKYICNVAVNLNLCLYCYCNHCYVNIFYRLWKLTLLVLFIEPSTFNTTTAV